MGIAVVILAAGQGTRMNSDLPKVLHTLAGVPMLLHAVRRAEQLAAERMIVVTGHGAEQVGAVAQAYNDSILAVVQDQQLGTAHAVGQTQSALADFDGDVVVLYGDTPFVSSETVQRMLDERAAGQSVVVLGFEAAYPGGYGRLICDAGGALRAIVEAKDATAAQKKINLCNSGVICADAATLFELISAVGNDNKSGEYYLTDIVDLAIDKGLTCAAVTCAESETMGINSRRDLAAAEAAFQADARAAAVENGATLVAPETVYFAVDTMLGRDVTIEPNVVFGPGVTIESGANIRAFSHLEGCHVSQGAQIGPYARLRPGAEIGDNARVGNFVEIKAALIGEGSKINHLSYIGDATIGQDVNIGAGTITCNFDGVLKHQTVIKDRAFIGSNTALVAPVAIGRDAMTGSGSVITRNVPDEALAVARAKQENKDGLATKLMQKLKAVKTARGKR